MPLTIAVTGAGGFIGSHLCTELEARGHRARRLVRAAPESADADCRVVGDLAVNRTLASVLAGADAVIHLAARAHVLKETERDPSAAFMRANVDATLRLAEAAVAAGVRRFVFVSSIGVNGNATAGRPFTEDDDPAPVDPYARSKLRAEQALRERVGAALELVVVRPPLVYGPGVKGNLHRLLSLVDSGVPLPRCARCTR
jgi:nucleoside-diphosphate-sugar epimerase